MSKYLKLLLFLPILVGSTVQIKAPAKRIIPSATGIAKIVQNLSSSVERLKEAKQTYIKRLKLLRVPTEAQAAAGLERFCDLSIKEILTILVNQIPQNAYALRFLGKTQGDLREVDMCLEMIAQAEDLTSPANNTHLLNAKIALLDLLCLILDAAQIQNQKYGFRDYQNGPGQIFNGFRQRDLNEARSVLNRNGEPRTKYLYNCGLISTISHRAGRDEEIGWYEMIENDLVAAYVNVITKETSLAKVQPRAQSPQTSPIILPSPASLPSVPSSPNIFSPASSRTSPGLSLTPRSSRSQSLSRSRTPQSFNYGPRMVRPSSAPQLSSVEQPFRSATLRRSASARRPDADYQVHPSLLPRVGGKAQTGAENYDIESLRARLNRLNEESQLAGELRPLQNRVAQLRGQLNIPDSPVAEQGPGTFDDSDSDFEREFDQTHKQFLALPSAAGLRSVPSAQSSTSKKKSGLGRAIKKTAQRFNPVNFWSSGASATPSVPQWQPTISSPMIQKPGAIEASTPLMPPSPKSPLLRSGSPKHVLPKAQVQRPIQKAPLSKADKIVRERNMQRARKADQRRWEAEHPDPAIARTYESVRRNAMPIAPTRFDGDFAVYSAGVPTRSFKIFAPQNIDLSGIIVKRDEILFPISMPGIESSVRITDNVNGFAPVINFDLSSGRYFAQFPDGVYSNSMDKVDVDRVEYYRIFTDVLFHLYRTIMR